MKLACQITLPHKEIIIMRVTYDLNGKLKTYE